MGPTSKNPQINVISHLKLSIFQKHRGRRIRKYFREYCENTGIHGFKYLAEERSWCERISWAILIIISISACGYMISRIYRKYQNSPVIVTFATKESPLFTIPFPAVTVCPIAKFEKGSFNYTRAYYKKKDNESLTTQEEINAQYFSLLCDKGADVFAQNQTFSEDFFDKIFKLRSPMVHMFPCVFMDKKMPCIDLFKPLVTDEGICLTFNLLNREEIFRDTVIQHSYYYRSDNASEWSIDKGYLENSSINVFPRRALLSGADNALEITLEQSRYNIDHLCADSLQGFNVMLHVPHSLPRPKKQSFNVPLDTAVAIVVQPRMITTSPDVSKYDPVDRECYLSNERPLKFFKIYTPDNCRLECLANYTLKQCDCVNFFMPRENGTLICGNGKFNCMKRAERRLMRGQLNKLSKMKEDGESEIYCDCMR